MHAAPGACVLFFPRTSTLSIMTSGLHLRRSSDRPDPCPTLWMRWMVLAFALMFGGISTAQAAHLHRPGLPGHHLQAPASGSQSVDNEEHCPLCVAIHAALPAPMLLAPARAVAVVQPAGRSPDIRAAAAWPFANFSRPPPALI